MNARICTVWLVFITLSSVLAAPSGPKRDNQPKAPKPEVELYNEAHDLLMQKEFAAAAVLLGTAIEINDRFAEAHNNLAYALRKQGKNEEALRHYNRAIELNGRLLEAYMYRGVLHVTMGNMDAAQADLAVLERRRSELAPELAYVIENGREKTPEQFFGVVGSL